MDQQQQALVRTNPNPVTCTFTDPDLNSRSQTSTPTFTFTTAEEHGFPIALFRCTNPRTACLHIKDWLLRQFSAPQLAAPGILRMDGLELHMLEEDKKKITRGLGEGEGNGKDGWMVLLVGGATVVGPPGGEKVPAAILAMLVPGDQRVRWFYTVLPIPQLLNRLDANNLIHLHKELAPGTAEHRRLFTYLREAFTAATTPPHSQDYNNALALTDCCPSISDSETAMKRIEGTQSLYSSHANPEASGKDLSDDRYLLDLHPAEREISSIAKLGCAEYLLVKRYFFKAFFEEIYRSDKKLDEIGAPGGPSYRAGASRGMQHPGQRQGMGESTPVRASSSTPADGDGEWTPAPSSSNLENDRGHEAAGPRARGRRSRVRTENAHRVWLEREYEFGRGRAKVLVVGWRVLGFLEEGRYVEWIRAGGIGMGIGEEEEEEE